jgi:hypothetical protein
MEGFPGRQERSLEDGCQYESCKEGEYQLSDATYKGVDFEVAEEFLC